MRLYHFTSRYHLPKILEAGAITTTESNVSQLHEHAGPDVVWLYNTNQIKPHTMLMAERILSDGTRRLDVNKSEVCIEVEIDDAESWEQWAVVHGSNRASRKALIAAGDGLHKHWWVVARPIPENEWVTIGATDEVWEDLGVEQPVE